MNGTDRLERELTTWFADTAAPQTPDWTADILAATATMRQRPRWSFPARWLPAAVVPRLPRLTLQPVPWRTIASPRAAWPPARRSRHALRGQPAAAPGTVRTRGERPRRLCRARRIWTVDPVTGVRKQIVTLPAATLPLAFPGTGRASRSCGRKAAGNCSRSRTRTARTWSSRRARRFVDADTDSIVWSPDGRLVAVVANAGPPRAPGTFGPRTTYLVDTTTGEVRDLDTPGVDTEVYWRPPDGRQLMYCDRRSGQDDRASSSSISRSRRVDPVAIAEPEVNLRPGGWTPDGKYFVVHRHDHGDDERLDSLLDPETGTDEPAAMCVRPGIERRDSNRRVPAISGTIRASASMPLSDGDCVQIADR